MSVPAEVKPPKSALFLVWLVVFIDLLGFGIVLPVLPRQVGDNPNLWSPGVKYGVSPMSVTHLTEFFGPLLGESRDETFPDQAVHTLAAALNADKLETLELPAGAISPAAMDALVGRLGTRVALI